jgi:hypothetical protein
MAEDVLVEEIETRYDFGKTNPIISRIINYLEEGSLRFGLPSLSALSLMVRCWKVDHGNLEWPYAALSSAPPRIAATLRGQKRSQGSHPFTSS